MSASTTLAGACLLAAVFFISQASAAPLKAPTPPAHKTIAQPTPADATCMDNTRLVSHVAFFPAAPSDTTACGHLLSTDTVLAVHHWDKT